MSNHARGGPDRYDVAIVGAGPVGSVCAVAHAQHGQRVALFEASPNASNRLAGEWLHPLAARILDELGIELDRSNDGTSGHGFAVFPEDGREPIILPYSDGSQALVRDHSALVSQLRDAADAQAGVELKLNARVLNVEDGRLTYSKDGRTRTVIADRIVGADGRSSVVRRSLGLNTRSRTCSRMVGLTMTDIELPIEGYGHVVCGAPGPMLIYRLDDQRVRAVVDIPLDAPYRDWSALLARSYAPSLPASLRDAFLAASEGNRFYSAANVVRPRMAYGTSQRVLIGDAVGHYHPLTATGITLGFGDALELANSNDFDRFRIERFDAIRVPEFLAMGLYEVMADQRAEAAGIRQAMYSRWRSSKPVRDSTMDLLACENTKVKSLFWEFSATLAWAFKESIPATLDAGAWREVIEGGRSSINRLLWLVRSAWAMHRVRRAGIVDPDRPAELLSHAFLTSLQPAPTAPADSQSALAQPDASSALERGAQRLMAIQNEQGGWEGEMVWCPMITAQWVLLHHIIGRPIDDDRRRRLLRYFETSRLPQGVWGMHEHSQPHLFVTTLVYVAARLLGVERDDPLLEPARRFLQDEGTLGIPSWGKFWLALVNLYDWSGVHPVLPELWTLPRQLPAHPSNWYCHTRLIYMAMAAIYPRRHLAPVTPVISELREELFPQGFDGIDFPAQRNELRDGDLFARPSALLGLAYRGADVVERRHSAGLRERTISELIAQIRWELNTTDHTCISPVSGLLNLLALWLHNPEDADLERGLEQLERWFWEDEQRGARVTGARSASWDSGFALQALSTAMQVDGTADSLRRGASYLLDQQIVTSFPGYRDAFRNDPKGGWCFAERWHGWPVTDCTAEAVLGVLAADRNAVSVDAMRDAVRFMLRGQGRDGGFGSYEAQRSPIDLEIINPAEMFGESMTEHSYVECTASCMGAIAAVRAHLPEAVDGRAERAMSRADAWLRRNQRRDGSWRGVWGVQYIYGTFFGIRGLIAGGAAPDDPALRRACQWLRDRQRPDGGWGEHHSGCLSGQYVAHDQSQVIQTAWALIALQEADDEDRAAISRGIQFLIDQQCADGSWPKQDMAGVFFRTALLDYVLYRQYFPLHALGLYEQHRKASAYDSGAGGGPFA